MQSSGHELTFGPCVQWVTPKTMNEPDIGLNITLAGPQHGWSQLSHSERKQLIF